MYHLPIEERLKQAKEQIEDVFVAYPKDYLSDDTMAELWCEILLIRMEVIIDLARKDGLSEGYDKGFKDGLREGR